MIEKENKPLLPSEQPTTNDLNSWRDYWQQLGQPWRIEPEINVERQKFLTEQRSITPDIEQGIYLFLTPRKGPT